MTTSYELSLRLKESGVPQEGGEYYWRNPVSGNGVYCAHETNAPYSTHICRAFTLGELVRELPEFTSILKLNDRFTIGGASYTTFIHNTSPEEAAGELLAAIKSQELKQKEG